jgi:hypothetical protein
MLPDQEYRKAGTFDRGSGPCGFLLRKRLTIGAVDGVAGFRRLVADSPSGGREFSDSIDGKIGQARKHRAQIVANW